MTKLKIFLSMPMNGFSEDYILDLAEKYMYHIRNLSMFANRDLELISPTRDSFSPLNEDEYKTPRLAYLGRSLQTLANADICAFVPGWEFAKGCKTELAACMYYGIRTIRLYPENHSKSAYIMWDRIRTAAVIPTGAYYNTDQEEVFY